MFYAKAIDLTILVALRKTSAAQTSGTTESENSIKKLLYYSATHPNETLRYKASRMVIKAHSEVSYFSGSQARSRAGDFFYMVRKTKIATDQMEQLWSYRPSCKTHCCRQRRRGVVKYCTMPKKSRHLGKP